MTITTADEVRLNALHGDVLKKIRRAPFWPLFSLGVLIFYLIYAWFAFDIPGLIERARLDRGGLLAVDSFAHKYHVTRSNRDGEVTVDIEGERATIFAEPPSWVTTGPRGTQVALGEGYTVLLGDGFLEYTVPNGRTYNVEVTEDEVILEGYRSILLDDRYVYVPPGGDPERDRMSAEEFRALDVLPPTGVFTNAKFEVRPGTFMRIQATRARTQVHRYFFGWEYFWFDPRSPLAGLGFWDGVEAMFADERIDPDMSNTELVLSEFWFNSDWQHGDVFKALLETIIMALLGTFVAAFVALPLAFAAAKNFNPDVVTRMAVRRFFDFVRSIDNLIWSLIFIRAFGLGPLTGIMAIAFTDTGTFGKLFSEAIENIDNKQVEGVRSTGSGTIQRYRFGVIPQILPVFVSQTLYYLESNTRSATVIGALGAGGIGLKLVETLRTGKDWENTLYLIVLTLMVVIAMDVGSGWLRRKLIGDEGKTA